MEGRTFKTLNPTNKKPTVAVDEATEKDVDIAISAAHEAFEGVWHDMTPSDCGRMLSKLADLFERDIETLAAIEVLDNGKAVTMVSMDVGNAAGCLRYYGDWADKIHG